MTDAPTSDPDAPDEAPEAPPEPADLAAAPDAEPAEAVEVVDEEALLDNPPPPPAPRESPYDRAGRWYVVHSYAGYENKVKADLENRTTAMNMEEKVFEVVIPMEEVTEIKGGKKQVVQKKMFPGYLLVRCDLDDDSWYVIRNTPGVTGFVGPGTCRKVSTSLRESGVGLVPGPTKPVTPGVLRMTYQESSSRSQRTRR